jgi:hypothetical protein
MVHYRVDWERFERVVDALAEVADVAGGRGVDSGTWESGAAAGRESDGESDELRSDKSDGGDDGTVVDRPECRPTGTSGGGACRRRDRAGRGPKRLRECDESGMPHGKKLWGGET